MKVERTTEPVVVPVFIPIVITLETEDEADYFWHLLNVASNVIKKHTDSQFDFPDDLELFPAWKAFSAIHRPREVN